ncbi:MAG: 4'-phosphopantetheinyl transferase superfamily protein [Oscillospiraceae bacterium]|nr:4'-phosphopantetheinyl transferase superfamily protein [Oscillospiraceae bacterium]
MNFETCFIVNFKNVSEQELLELLKILSTNESFIKNENFIEKTMPKIVGKVLIKYIASRILNVSKNSLIFLKNPNGKPFLKDFPKFCFNISHTNNAVVIFVSRTCVGIDVERIRKINFKISDRFFHDEERKILSGSPRKIDTFFEIWTKKESHVKYYGEGFFNTFAAFNVFCTKLKIKTFKNNGLCISICKGGNFEFNITEISLKRLNLIFKEN